MNSGLAQIYRGARTFSRSAVFAACLIFGLFQLLSIHLSISLQIVIAIIALMVGIPHGAIDHLITIPTQPRDRFLIFIFGYTAIAIIAGIAIAHWNIMGFRGVLVMSALHFGFGDASFANEAQSALGANRFSIYSELLFALPAGFLPVILPLTNSNSASALNRINHGLNSWSGSYSDILRKIVLVVAIGSILIFLSQKKFGLALDLWLLLVLSIMAPPLIAFAMYFGTWHAVRHTARLVPQLPKANDAAKSGRIFLAWRSAIFPGLYAVVGTLAIGVTLMIWAPHNFGYGLLWSALVVVWALTVPHMLTTARLDLKAVRSS